MNTDELLVLFLTFVIATPIAVMFFVTWWRIFEKGGENGWAIFVPFYNAYILGKVAGSDRLGIGVLIVSMIYFVGILVALVVIFAIDSEDVANVAEFIFAMPWLVMRLIIAFKLGGKFGRGVWFRVFLAIPYLNAFPHLYLALSKKCVYSETPKEASAGLFIMILLIPTIVILLLIMLVTAVPRFIESRTDAQIATARSDLASAQKAIVAKVFADNIDAMQSTAPNGESWGEWIMKVAELDESMWKASGNGIYAIDNSKRKRKACYDKSALPLLWINPRDGAMHFNPSRLSNNYNGDGFCEQLMMSYESNNGTGDKVTPLASSGTIEF